MAERRSVGDGCFPVLPNTCAMNLCKWPAQYWWHSADGRKRLGMCFGHATWKQMYGEFRERKVSA